MKQVKQLVTFLEGKKSYIVAGAIFLDGLYQYYVQHGSNYHVLLTYVLSAAGVASLRAAIAKGK